MHHLVRSYAPFNDEKRAQMIELLCRSPGDIDTCDAQGRTALHLVLQQRSYGFVKSLLEHGADTDRVDHEGKSARNLYRESNALNGELEDLWNAGQRTI